jgi:general secretion pathway protein M
MITRERKVLIAGAIGAAILLFIAFAWIPMERARARLLAQVPRLEASVQSMERAATEVQRLRAMPAPQASAAAMPLASLVASGALTRDLPGSQAALADERRVRVNGGDLAYGALLEAIASAQAVHGLRVESARIEKLPAAGRVRAELVLARS